MELRYFPGILLEGQTKTEMLRIAIQDLICHGHLCYSFLYVIYFDLGPYVVSLCNLALLLFAV
jgi:hypothetical protein